MKKTLLIVITTVISLTSFGQVYLTNKSICQSSTSIVWSTSTSSSSYTWKWYKLPSMTIIGSNVGTSISHTFTPSDTGNYKVIRYTGVTPVDSNVGTLSLIPNPNSGTIDGGNDTICNGITMTLYDTTSNSTTGTGWGSFNGNVYITPLGPNDTISVIGLTPGIDTIYYVSETFSSYGSCGTDTTTKLITVLPTSSGVISGIDTVCIGHTITLTDTINGGVWTTGTNTTINSIGVLTGVSTGIDTVSYTVVNSCGTYVTTKTIEVNDCSLLGTSIPVKSNDVEIYPNPTKDFITISSDLIITDIVMKNMVGQTVLTGKFTDKKVQVDLSHFPNGIYFVTINGNDILKVVKQ